MSYLFRPMSTIEAIASEAYSAYWMCTLNTYDESSFTQWDDLVSEVKETWIVVAKSVLINSVQLEVLYVS